MCVCVCVRLNKSVYVRVLEYVCTCMSPHACTYVSIFVRACEAWSKPVIPRGKQSQGGRLQIAGISGGEFTHERDMRSECERAEQVMMKEKEQCQVCLASGDVPSIPERRLFVQRRLC